MNRAVIDFVLFAAYGAFAAQDARPRIVKLPAPAYPPIALAAHVSGDVKVKVMLKNDGSVYSTEAINGPAMLQKPALALAAGTGFECGGCGAPTTEFHVIVRFQFGETIFCEGRDSSYPRITESANTMTVIDRPFGTCDPAATIDQRIRARSLRCIYLWKCSWRVIEQIDN